LVTRTTQNFTAQLLLKMSRRLPKGFVESFVTFFYSSFFQQKLTLSCIDTLAWSYELQLLSLTGLHGPWIRATHHERINLNPNPTFSTWTGCSHEPTCILIVVIM